MYSSVVFLIYATGMVMARSIADVTSTNCTEEYNEELRRTSKNGGCDPYYTHVTLEPEEGQQYSPSSVYIRRCGGYAHASAECEPTSDGIKIIRVPVTVLSSSGSPVLSQETCFSVKVPEHVACEVKCKKGSKNCGAGRYFDDNTCKCVCEDGQNKRNECQGLRTFDHETCQCKCEASECPSNSKWNSITCNCE